MGSFEPPRHRDTDRKTGDRKMNALDSHFPVIYLPVIFGCRADGAPALAPALVKCLVAEMKPFCT